MRMCDDGVDPDPYTPTAKHSDGLAHATSRSDPGRFGFEGMYQPVVVHSSTSALDSRLESDAYPTAKHRVGPVHAIELIAPDGAPDALKLGIVDHAGAAAATSAGANARPTTT